MDLFGYYPTTVAPSSVSTPSEFTYTVVPDAKDLYDVVTAYSGNQTKGIVQMQFLHALSKINSVTTSYKNSGLNISINSIAIKNIPMSAYPLKGTYINLNGSLTDVADYTGNIAIPITTVKWEPGYSYTYNFVFDNESGSTGGGGYNPDNSTDGGSSPEQILRPIDL